MSNIKDTLINAGRELKTSCGDNYNLSYSIVSILANLAMQTSVKLSDTSILATPSKNINFSELNSQFTGCKGIKDLDTDEILSNPHSLDQVEKCLKQIDIKSKLNYNTNPIFYSIIVLVPIIAVAAGGYHYIRKSTFYGYRGLDHFVFYIQFLIIIFAAVLGGVWWGAIVGSNKPFINEYITILQYSDNVSNCIKNLIAITEKTLDQLTDQINEEIVETVGTIKPVGP